MFEDLFEQLVNETSEEDLQIGDRVIVRSNEDAPLMIGEYIGDQEFGQGSKLPLIKSESDGKTYFVGGIVRKYSEELMGKLSSMDPKEQWNYLCYPHMRKE